MPVDKWSPAWWSPCSNNHALRESNFPKFVQIQAELSAPLRSDEYLSSMIWNIQLHGISGPRKWWWCCKTPSSAARTRSSWLLTPDIPDPGKFGESGRLKIPHLHRIHPRVNVTGLREHNQHYLMPRRQRTSNNLYTMFFILHSGPTVRYCESTPESYGKGSSGVPRATFCQSTAASDLKPYRT